jgi:hypothetical protein
MGRGASTRFVVEDKPPPWPNISTSSSAAPPPAKRARRTPPPSAVPVPVPVPVPIPFPAPPQPRLVQAVAQAPIQLTDDLGKYAAVSASVLNDKGWESLVVQTRGRSNLQDSIGKVQHPAARLLDHYRKVGAPILMKTAPWSLSRRDTAVKRGCHPSATEYKTFLRGEMTEMVRRGQWMVLPYSAVRHLPDLRISPPGVVPQRDRRPRLIVDYTFSGVNADTVPLAPKESMQFGTAFQRLLHKIFRADPRWGPVFLMKGDIADGFYQGWLRAVGVPRLGLVMPAESTDREPLIAFPLAAPMGWVESPPFFTALSETAADLGNGAIQAGVHPLPHRHDHIADTNPDPAPTSTKTPMQLRRKVAPHAPVGCIDVYVDDFIGLAQGPARRRRRIRAILFHAIDHIFRPPDQLDPDHRKDPISIKKLLKGDGAWETTKLILGWLVDTIAGTIRLPVHRFDRLQEILKDFHPERKRASIKSWHKLLGELRSMVLAIPGGHGLFSTLQDALSKSTLEGRIRLTRPVHDFLQDFRLLASQLAARPTRIAEIIPGEPDYMGSADAAGIGMGGVWLPDTGQSHAASHPPILWRSPFPQFVRDNLSCFQNPSGSITNSDLELAGNLAQQDILAQELDLTEANLAIGTDNMATESWRRKGSSTSSKARAYLLRLGAFHQRHYRYLQTSFYVSGPANAMADDCSRRFDLSDPQLLAYFDATYPQNERWQQRNLRPVMNSALISSLQCKRLLLPEITHGHELATTCGTPGNNSARRSGYLSSYTTLTTPSHSSKFSPVVTGTAASPAVVNRSGLALWRKPYVPLVARSPCWGPQTLV